MAAPAREGRPMLLGMNLETFTIVHVIISMTAILTGFLVAISFLGGKPLGSLNATFLVTTILTSVTGFMFPISTVTPGIILGGLSLIVLAVACMALYSRHLAGAWRSTYVITVMIALYFNFFVLIVQSFQKVPTLKALAPTQSEPPFAITQGVALVGFIALTIAAVKKFRHAQEPTPPAKSSAASAR